jgi:class 3 adenylate cyclase
MIITLAHRRKIQVYSIMIMICIALLVAMSGFFYLYRVQVQQSRTSLEELVQSQARIYEAIAKYDAVVTGNRENHVSRAATISQIKEAHRRYNGFGDTGELVLAERVEDAIVFLLPTRKMGFEVPPDVPWDSDRAGPMKLALQDGGSGIVQDLDHTGDEVLAAYEHLPFLDMGLVAKMNVSELRRPFVMAALYTSLVAWLAILVGALLNIRLVGPLVATLIETNQKLKDSEQHLKDLAGQLSKYLSPQLYHSIFEGKKTARIESHRKKLTVFFSDMVGFTAKTDSMQPEDLSYVLNGYLNRMAEIILQHGGTLDKFIGDAVLVFYGDPESHGPAEDAKRSIAMALEMRAAIETLQREWSQHGIDPEFSVRSGVATGFCTVGNFGSENRMEYTIIGGVVNLASRLESLAKPGEILISQETATLVEGAFELEPVGEIQVKGLARPVKTFRVLGGRQGPPGRSRVHHQSAGFDLAMDLEAVPEEEKEAVVRTLQEAITRLKQ